MRLRDWFKSKKAKAIAMLGCFAMLLGVGASVSVVSAVKENEVVETKADNSHTVYFIDAGWWRTDVVGVFLYAWDSSTATSPQVTQNAPWPGVAMTPPSSINPAGGNTYYAIVDVDKYDSIIFSRTNASGVDAQTVDISVSDSGLDANDTYSIAGTSAAWIGEGNKVTGFWSDSTKANWWLVGEGSFTNGGTWTTASGVRMKRNTNNTNDKGMILHQKLTEGDIFKITDGSSAWKGSGDFEATSMQYPVFETYHNSHLMHYVYEDNGTKSNANGTYGNADEHASATDIYIENQISWYLNDGYVPGIKTNTNELIAGTYVSKSGSNNQYRVTINPKEYTSYVIGRVKGSSFLNQASGSYSTSSLGSSETNIYVAKTGYYDIYLTSATQIYIKNSYDDSKGYLYVSMKNASGTAFTDNSGEPYVHAWYVSKSNTEYKITGNWGTRKFTDSYYGYTENLAFNSKGGLYRLPLSILNGASKFILYSYGGSATKWQSANSNVPTSSGPLYCLVTKGAAISTDSTKGKAAEAAYHIERAIAGATNQTVCALTVAEAGTLVAYYDTATAASASGLHTSATVSTYVASGNYYRDGAVHNTTKTNISLSVIYTELHSRATTGNWTVRIVSGPSNDQSPLTLTLWIVLGAGVLGLGAIGTAYFVSKKKKKHQA
ncbi:MAG: hypothetical protein IJS37_05440 [Bacilli bacterium]|nr:hypothetical protein [Bacilli bacterium]